MKCPVCDRENPQLLCSSCGYDGSLHYEAFPTLARLTRNAKTLSAVRSLWEEQQAGMRCASCGHWRFLLGRPEGKVLCAACHTPLGEAQLRQLFPELCPPPKPVPVPAPKPVTLIPPRVPKYGCTVVAAGGFLKGQSNVKEWRNVTALAAGWFHSIGLRSDGTILAAGQQKCHYFYPETWKNIVAVAAGGELTVGLRSNGTVVSSVDRTGFGDTRSWTGITAISVSASHILGLRNDGMVLSTLSAADAFLMHSIQAVAAGDHFSVGLRKDGTVVTSSTDKAVQYAVSGWKDIVAIAAGDRYVTGLRSDGTVVTTVPNSPARSWTDIVAISASGAHILGLRQNGTVVCTDSFIDVSGWKNIVSIALGRTHALGLKTP